MLQLIITGCGRSGTHWANAVISQGGISCSHEHALKFQPFATTDFVEVSWTALAFLPLPHELFPTPYTVWHLVRHPIAVACSFRSKNFFHDVNPSFALRGHPEVVEKALGYFPSGPYAELDYWLDWTKLTESFASQTFRIEDLNTSTLLSHVSKELNMPVSQLDEIPPVDTTGSLITSAINFNLPSYPRLDELKAQASHFNYKLDI